MRLWTAQTIEAVGGEFTTIAMQTLAILLVRAGPMEIGILFGLQTLPVPILGMFVGVWADRWRRRPIMIAANLGRMITLGWVPIAQWLGVLSLYQLYFVTTLFGIFTVFYDIANQSYLPSLIDRENLIEGNSKLQTTQSAAGVIGLPLATALILLLGSNGIGAAKTFAVEACGFLCSALLILSIRKLEVKLPPKKRNFAREMKEGAEIVFNNRVLRNITACTALLNLGSGIYFTVVYLFMYQQLNLSIAVVGTIWSVAAVGFVIGALLTPRVTDLFGMGLTLALSIVFQGVCLAFVPVAANEGKVLVIALLLMLSNVGIPIYNINQVSLRQAITPGEIQGRMNATVRVIIRGAIPLGFFIGGLLGNQYGIVLTLIIGAVISTLGFVFLIFKPVRTVRDIPRTSTV